MIQIYNSNKQVKIDIDEELDWIQFTPYTYLEPKHIKIEFKNGFNFLNHSNSCKDCKQFLNSFGRDTNDWFLKYNDKLYKINTKNIGQKDFGSNEISAIYSNFEYGSKLTLSLFELNLDELKILEKQSVELDEFEKACIFRDLQKELNN